MTDCEEECTCGGVQPPFTETNRPCFHCIMTGLSAARKARESK